MHFAIKKEEFQKEAHEFQRRGAEPTTDFNSRVLQDKLLVLITSTQDFKALTVDGLDVLGKLCVLSAHDKTADQRKMALKDSIAALEKASRAKEAEKRIKSKAAGKRKATPPVGKNSKPRGVGLL